MIFFFNLTETKSCNLVFREIRKELYFLTFYINLSFK